jgi:phage terminase large subunit
MIPTKKQQLAINYLTDTVTEFLGYGGAAGGGKTILGCYWLMQMGFYAPETKYFIGRDSLKDTRESVLHTWSYLASKIGFKEFKYSDNHICFFNGSEIEFLDLSFYPEKDPLYERFGSKEYTSGWIEEAGSVHPMAFEVLKSRIGRWRNEDYNIKKKILCTFNPKKNWVDTTFYRPFVKNQEEKNTKFIYALPTDNPHLPPDYLATLSLIKDKSTRERLLNGNFDYDDDPNTLIDYDTILNMFSNIYAEHGIKYIIADIARYGSDRAILTVWDKYVLIEYLVFDISSTVVLQNAITALRTKYKIPLSNVLVDEDGIGGGIVDNLRCKGFLNNGKPINSHYQNLKTECGYKLSENANKIFISCELPDKEIDMIKQELAMLKTYDADKDGKLRILPKEKIKESIGRSPDWLDIFIMRMFYEKFSKKTTDLSGLASRI